MVYCLLLPVPCTPANISSEVNCETNSLTVSWAESSGANSYIAKAQDSDGQTITCQGMSEGYCNVTGIGCGQIYHVSVVSSDGYCESPSTPEVETPSGRTDHQQNPAETPHVSSNAEIGIISTNNSKEGKMVIWMDGWIDGCDLEGLLCGQNYSVSVRVVGQTCSSMAHMIGPLVTGNSVVKYFF